MSITLISGDIGTGKTNYLLNRMQPQSQLNAGMFILPDDSKAEQYRNKISTENNQACMLGERAVSWQRFCYLLASPKQTVLSRFQSQWIIFHYLTSNSLVFFNSKYPSYALAKQITNTILALKRNFIDFKTCHHILNTRGSKKENDLLTIFKLYTAHCHENNLIDTSDVYSLAYQRICEKTSRPTILNNPLLIDECIFPEPGQVKILQCIDTHYPHTSIYIACPTSSIHTLYQSFLSQNLEYLKSSFNNHTHTHLPNIPAHTPQCKLHIHRSSHQEALAWANYLSKEKKTHTIFFERQSELPTLIQNEWVQQNNLNAKYSPTIKNAYAYILENILQYSIHKTESIETWQIICHQFLQTFLLHYDSPAIDLHAEKTDYTARALATIARIDSAIKMIAYSATKIDLTQLSRYTFVELLSEALTNNNSHDGFNHTPHIVSNLSSGLCTSVDISIIPECSDSNIPGKQSSPIFFNDFDQLSPLPDKRIEQIFLTKDKIKAMSRYHFDTILQKSKQILFSHAIINHSGSEMAISPWIPDNTSYHYMNLQMRHINFEHEHGHNQLNQNAQIALERHLQVTQTPEFHAIITHPDAKEIIYNRFHDTIYSPSTLERFASCPFIFFIEKVLNLNAPDEITPDLNARNKGTLFHAILEYFFIHHTKLAKSCIFDFNKTALLSALEDSISNALHSHKDIAEQIDIALHAQQIQVLTQMAWHVICMEIKQAAELKNPLWPSFFEWSFGTDTVPCLEIPSKKGYRIRIRGQIDRVDVDDQSTCFLIVDYKTGAVGSIKKDILLGKKLQLPLYTLAASKHLLPKAMPLGGLLLDVKENEKIHGFVRKDYNTNHYNVGRCRSAMTDDDWHACIDAALNACQTYVEEICSGKFPIQTDKQCPMHCGYSNICRKSYA